MKEYTRHSSLSLTQIILAAFGLVGGTWLILASFVLNYSGITVLDAATKKQVPVDLQAVTTSDITAGIILIGLGLACLLVINSKLIYRIQMIATIGIIAAGLYLMVVPYLFDLLKVASYMGLDKPNTNDQLVGILAVIVAGFAFEREFLAGKKETSETLTGTVTA